MDTQEVQWSRLLKKQDEYVHNADESEHQYRKNLKHLYKKQLDSLIQEHRRHSQDEKMMDRQLMDYSKRVAQAKQEEQRQKYNSLHMMQEKLARDNLRSVENRRKRRRIETEGVKDFYNHKFEKLQTEIEQQGKFKVKKKQTQKKQLSIAYDEQITEHQRRKQWQKIQDEKMMNLLRQIEDKKQKQRQKYFNKIRSYHQNPEVYDNVKKIMYKKEHNQSQFLQKIASIDAQEEAEKIKTIEENQKYRKIVEVSNFNHNSGQEKKFQQRHQSMQEMAQYSRRFDELNRRLKKQQQQKQYEAERKRMQLKEELEHQIQDIERKKKRENMLDQREFQLNKSSQVPALPGLWKDHSAIRQQQIIENFLKGKSAYK